MSLLKNFDETGKEIGSEDVSITETNFQKYIEQYGPERAAGYRDAVADIMNSLWDILPVPFSVHKMGTRSERLLYKTDAFLIAITKILAADQKSTPSIPDQSYTP